MRDQAQWHGRRAGALLDGGGAAVEVPVDTRVADGGGGGRGLRVIEEHLYEVAAARGGRGQERPGLLEGGVRLLGSRAPAHRLPLLGHQAELLCARLDPQGLQGDSQGVGLLGQRRPQLGAGGDLVEPGDHREDEDVTSRLGAARRVVRIDVSLGGHVPAVLRQRRHRRQVPAPGRRSPRRPPRRATRPGRPRPTGRRGCRRLPPRRSRASFRAGSSIGSGCLAVHLAEQRAQHRRQVPLVGGKVTAPGGEVLGGIEEHQAVGLPGLGLRRRLGGRARCRRRRAGRSQPPPQPTAHGGSIYHGGWTATAIARRPSSARVPAEPPTFAGSPLSVQAVGHLVASAQRGSRPGRRVAARHASSAATRRARRRRHRAAPRGPPGRPSPVTPPGPRPRRRTGTRPPRAAAALRRRFALVAAAIVFAAAARVSPPPQQQRQIGQNRTTSFTASTPRTNPRIAGHQGAALGLTQRALLCSETTVWAAPVTTSHRRRRRPIGPAGCA